MVIRMTGAALILSPWLVRALIRNSRFFADHWLLIVTFGIAGVLGTQLFYLSAIQRLPVGVALLIMNLAPVILVARAWIATRHRPRWLVLSGTVISVMGLVVAANVAGSGFDLLGVLLAIASAACLATYFVAAEKAGHAVPPLALTSGGLAVGALATAALCGIGVMPFIIEPTTVEYGGISVLWLVAVGWIAFITTSAGFGLGVVAVPLIGSRLASFIGLTEILVASGFAWLLLNEAPDSAQVIGGGLILIGVALIRAEPSSPEIPRGETSAAPSP